MGIACSGIGPYSGVRRRLAYSCIGTMAEPGYGASFGVATGEPKVVDMESISESWHRTAEPQKQRTDRPMRSNFQSTVFVLQGIIVGQVAKHSTDSCHASMHTILALLDASQRWFAGLAVPRSERHGHLYIDETVMERRDHTGLTAPDGVVSVDICTCAITSLVLNHNDAVLVSRRLALSSFLVGQESRDPNTAPTTVRALASLVFDVVARGHIGPAAWYTTNVLLQSPSSVYFCALVTVPSPTTTASTGQSHCSVGKRYPFGRICSASASPTVSVLASSVIKPVPGSMHPEFKQGLKSHPHSMNLPKNGFLLPSMQHRSIKVS